MNNIDLMRSEARATTPEPIFRLIYRSRCRIPAETLDVELGSILRGARMKNAAAGISGALLLYDNWFAQTLEGAEGPVRSLYAKIAADPRHDSIELREQGMAPARVFPRWSMAMVGEHGEHDIPLMATPTGTAAGAARTSTPEQELVLSRMRDTTRGYGRGS